MKTWSKLALLLLSGIASAQLPKSETLSAADEKLFRAEVAQMDALLADASDKATVSYVMARTWAAAKQWPQAVEWLGKVANLKAGFDPSRDPRFSAIANTSEFAAIMAVVLESTPPVARATPAFEIPEGDLRPESMAYDPRGRRFYFGSMTRQTILRCNSTGKCETFAGGLGVVLGIKMRADGLWALSNSGQESALLHFDPARGTVIRKYTIAGPEHAFNDLAFAPEGDIYLTDTRAGMVFHLAPDGSELTQLAHPFPAANGITLSPDGRLLYVSSFGDGIDVMDLKTRKVSPLRHPGDLCLGMIDGLYFHKNSLLAIQNGFMSPRVVRMKLGRDPDAIESFEVLERRNPLFEGITTGVIEGGDFYFMANIQDGRQTGFRPITILKLHL